MVLTLYPDPGGQGGPKQGLGCIYSFNCETRQKFYKTKVVGKICFSGGGSSFWAKIQIWKDLGPMCFWSHGQSYSGKVYLKKMQYYGAHLPCHLCPHNTLHHFNIMTQAMSGSPSQYIIYCVAVEKETLIEIKKIIVRRFVNSIPFPLENFIFIHEGMIRHKGQAVKGQFVEHSGQALSIEIFRCVQNDLYGFRGHNKV